MVSMGKMPLTPRSKKVVEYSIEAANALGHSYVGTEHLLLGLLQETDGVASQILTGIGISLDGVKAEVMRMIGRGSTDDTKDSRPETLRAVAITDAVNDLMTALERFRNAIKAATAN